MLECMYIKHKGGIGLARFDDVEAFLNGLNAIFIQMNASEDVSTTSSLALQATHLADGVNWGHSSNYVNDIVTNLSDLSMVLGESRSEALVEEINASVKAFTQYLAKSWWQYGAGQRNRAPIGEVPRVTVLGE